MTRQFTAILLLTLSLLTACGNGGEVETLTQERDALQGQVGELDTQLNTVGAERDDLLIRVEAAEGEQDELQGQVGELNTQLNTVGAERDELQGKVEELSTQVTSIEGERDELLIRVETVEGERDELQGQVGELDTRVTTVEAERDDLQARIEALAEELEQAQQEVLNLNIERDEILAGIQEEFAVQIVDLHNDLQEMADILVVVEQERNELRERLGQGVLPPLDSPEEAGEGTSTPQQGPQDDVEESAPPTVETSPGTLEVDTSRQIGRFKERIEQIKSQMNQP